LDEEFRGSYHNANRWFKTIVSQAELKSVVGEVQLCSVAEVPAVHQKKECKKGKGNDNKEHPKECKGKGKGNEHKEHPKGCKSQNKHQKPDVQPKEEKEIPSQVASSTEAEKTIITKQPVLPSPDIYFRNAKYSAKLELSKGSVITSTIVNKFSQNFNGIEVSQGSDKVRLVISDGTSLEGDLLVARFLARISPDLEAYEDVLTATEIDALLDSLPETNEASLKSFASHLESHLVFRTYLSGHRLSIADLAVFFHLGGGFEKNLTELPHLTRWFRFVKSIVL